jgi:hypothetical protein
MLLTIVPVADGPATGHTTTATARADFARARRRQRAAGVRRRLTARQPATARPPDLGGVAALFWRPARLGPIPLDAIVGTVDATPDFDSDFAPATDRVAARWQSVARAYRAGCALPPIAVIERRDGYYVLDGRHRVSVARALGHPDIDAWTTPAPLAPQPHPPPPPTTAKRTMTHLIHRLLTTVARALSADHPDRERVHFHAGDGGRPYVCGDPRCSSPRLDVAPG